MLTQPPIKLRKTYSACLVKIEQEGKRICVVKLQAVAVDAQERRRHGHRDAFVAVHERVVLGETFPQSRRFLNQVAVVPASGPADSRAA